MRHILVLGTGALFYVLFAHDFSVWFWTQWGGPRAVPRSDFQAGIWTICLGMAVGQFALGLLWPACRALLSILFFPVVLMFGRGKGRAIWSTGFGRRIIGMTAHGGVWLSGILVVTVPVFVLARLVSTATGTKATTVWLVVIAVGVLAALLLPNDMVKLVKHQIGIRSRQLRLTVIAMGFGFGGSGRFGGLLEEWCHPWRPGLLPLGSSIYDPNWRVGIADDRNFLTIATSRSGKGTASIIPTLLTWKGSILVIDVKGENAAVTAQARRDMGQDVHIVDPFEVLKSVGITDKVSRFDPLASIDPYGLRVMEEIEVVAEALVKPNPAKEDSFWDKASRDILAGLIAHAITWPMLQPHERTLVQVHKWIAQGLPLADMRRNPVFDGAVQDVAAGVVELSKVVGADVMGTLRTHVKWMNSLAMRRCLGAADFTVGSLKRRPTTIYLVIPPNYLSVHSRFLRLFVNLACSGLMNDPEKAPEDVLLLLDEFYTLGRMERVAEAASNITGYGVRIWPIIHNLGQVQELYPRNWETFLGNAGVWQVFAVNDASTARYLSERLGHHVRWRKLRTQEGGTEWIPQGPTFFRTAREITQETSRDSGRQFILREGGDCLFLRRDPYFKTFPATAYRKNPFNERRTTWDDAKPAEEAWSGEAGLNPNGAGTAKPSPEHIQPAAPPPAPVDEKAETFKDLETVHDSVLKTRH